MIFLCEVYYKFQIFMGGGGGGGKGWVNKWKSQPSIHNDLGLLHHFFL